MGDGPRCGINLTFEERWNLQTRKQAQTLKEMDAKKRKKVEAEKKAAEAAVQAAADAEYFKRQKLNAETQGADSAAFPAESASSSSQSIMDGTLTDSQVKDICAEVWEKYDQGLLTGSQSLQDPGSTPATLDYDLSWLEIPSPKSDPDVAHESQEAEAGSPLLPTLLDESLVEDGSQLHEADVPNEELEKYYSAACEDSQF